MLSCAFLLMVFAGAARSQGNETVEYQPEKARHLAGLVTDVTGKPIAGVVVEDCDANFKQVLGSVTTDINGRFSFSHVKHGSKHYLKIRFPNYDLDQHIVTISLFAKARLNVQLHVGT